MGSAGSACVRWPAGPASHTAPAHHFGDVRGLLTSVAAEGFEALEHETTVAAARHDDPVEQLMAIGEAYVNLARSHPAHCAVMFRTDIVDQDDGRLQQCGLGAYGVLERTVQAVIEDRGLSDDVTLDDVTWMCWSTMQGLVELESKFNTLRGAAPTMRRCPPMSWYAGSRRSSCAASALIRRIAADLTNGRRAQPDAGHVLSDLLTAGHHIDREGVGRRSPVGSVQLIALTAVSIS